MKLKIEELSRLALSGIKLQDYDLGSISDCIFRAIRSIQKLTFCSKGIFSFSVPNTVTDVRYYFEDGSKEVKLYIAENHGFQKGDEISIVVQNTGFYSSDGVYARLDSSQNNDLNWFIKDVGYDWIKFDVIQTAVIAPPDSAIDRTPDTPSMQITLQGEQKNRPILCFYDKSMTNNNADFFHVSPLLIDELYDVFTDGSLNRYNLYDRNKIQRLSEEATFSYSRISEMNGAIDFEADGVNLITSFDQRGKSFKVVMRYMIPYIRDYNILKNSTSNIPDVMISTVPDVMMDALMLGSKLEIYKHMEEYTGMLGKYQRQIDRFEMDWIRAVSDAKSKMNKYLSKETVAVIRPDSILGSS